MKSRKEEDLKMVLHPLLLNPENTIGLVSVDNFKGKTMHINPHYLQEVMTEVIKQEDLKDVEIGIGDAGTARTFFIFIDGEKEEAIAISGRSE